MAKKSITHLTSLHSRNDTRVFLKQCRSTASAGFITSLVVADEVENQTIDDVEIYSVGKSKVPIIKRAVNSFNVFRQARKLKADLYQLHDPELLVVGLALKGLGYHVAFDAHEDVSKQILSKPYIPIFLRPLVSQVYSVIEWFICRRLDLLFCATPSISKIFENMGMNAILIANYPIQNELVLSSNTKTKQSNSVCFVGGATQIRGIRELVQAVARTKNGLRLELAGEFGPAAFGETVMAMDEFENVDFLGFLDRKKVAELLASSTAGVVTFLPEPNHVDALPNKLFEYMSAGLPVIASNFPLWKQIVTDANCGICVDPTDVDEIAAAMDRLASDPALRKRMSANGKRAVKEKYNWKTQSEKLIAAYEKLLED